jgi:hypothetical protein
MLSEDRIRDLRAKAHARARGQTDATLLAAASKAERVRDYLRSDDARTAFTILAEAYRQELKRRGRR